MIVGRVIYTRQKQNPSETSEVIAKKVVKEEDYLKNVLTRVTISVIPDTPEPENFGSRPKFGVDNPAFETDDDVFVTMFPYKSLPEAGVPKLRKTTLSPPSSPSSKRNASNGPVHRRRSRLYSVSSHSKFLLHHHHDNTMYHITHDEKSSEICKDPECTLTECTSLPASSRMTTPRHSVVSTQSHSNISMKSTEEDELLLMSEWKDLLIHIIPFDLKEWPESRWIERAYLLWKVTFSVTSFDSNPDFCLIQQAPIYFLLLMTVPVVDYESYKQNWCRYLNCFHLLSGPLTILLLTHS